MKRESIGPGQESVWDYPRPPACQAVSHRLRVMAGDDIIADTTRGYRVLETSHPPVYYIPPEDIRMDRLRPNGRQTTCEWKGRAESYDLVRPKKVDGLAWGYPRPSTGYEAIAGHLAFYAGKAGPCYVDDEQVTPQPGTFYGGWITKKIKGPFKGAPGTMGW